MARQKSKAKKRSKKNTLPLITAGAILILFAIVFTIIAIATSRADKVVGKTYEVSKVKVTLTAEAKTNLSDLGMSVSDLSNAIAKEVKGAPITFADGTNYKIDGSKVTIDGVEYKCSFGKLIGEMQYSDGITVKVTLKEKK